MKTTVKKKVRIRILPILVILCTLVLLYFLGKFLLDEPIRNIIVTGNVRLSDQTIIELAEIEEYPSFLLSFSSTLKKRIEESPWIQSCKVTKSFFGIVKINVKETEPLFSKVSDKKLVLSSGEEILEYDSNIEVCELLNYVPSQKYQELIKQMGRVDVSTRYLISEMTYLPNEQDKDRFLLYISDGNYVYLTLTKFDHINYYEQVLEQLDGKKGILYLDSGNHFQIMEEADS